MRATRRTVHGLATLGMVALCGLSCDNAGSDRVLGVDATGVVNAFVFLDLDGNRVAEEAQDAALDGIRVSFVIRGTLDTTVTATTDEDGSIRVDELSVGVYDVLVDTTTFGDSVSIVQQDSQRVTVPAADSIFFRVAVSFPIIAITDLRNAPPGRKVFVEGVALAGFGIFGDSTLHLADTSDAVRASIRRTTVAAGDSVRLLGRRGDRAGQPILREVTVVPLGFGAIPPAETVTSAAAAAADGGRLDAALVRVPDVTIADTATVTRDFILTVDDGSGPLTVRLEDEAALDTSGLEPGMLIDVLGVLVPDGQGAWVLKPRQDSDLTLP